MVYHGSQWTFLLFPIFCDYWTQLKFFLIVSTAANCAKSMNLQVHGLIHIVIFSSTKTSSMSKNENTVFPLLKNFKHIQKKWATYLQLLKLI